MKVNFESLFTTRNIVVLIVLVCFTIIGFSVFRSSYSQQIETLRKEKNRFFESAYQSPIVDKATFKGLNYFSIDINYKVKAHLEFITGAESIEMLSSDGRRAQYEKYAWITFSLYGTEIKALLFKHVEENAGKMAFFPFSDSTSGNETYKTGRYIDVPIDGTETIYLDFNQAYNPYCFYNYRYSCPIPPKENRLKVAIKAGEKI